MNRFIIVWRNLVSGFEGEVALPIDEDIGTATVDQLNKDRVRSPEGEPVIFLQKQPGEDDAET